MVPSLQRGRLDYPCIDCSLIVEEDIGDLSSNIVESEPSYVRHCII